MVKKFLDKLPKHQVVMHAKSHRMAHMVYSMKAIEDVEYTHRKTEGIKDKLAHGAVRLVRSSFDFFSRYDPEKMTERDWMNRAIFLETVAGVPGMIGGMSRHLRSLRTLERDHGWIHHLLQEAENERMHLFFFLTMRNPGIFFRIAIALGQGIFFNAYFLAYLLAPRTCHRFVGYLEEEAVHTYSTMIEQLDDGKLPYWSEMKASPEAREYYGLSDDAPLREMILAIRADEATHRDTNHHFADINAWDDVEQHMVTIIENKEKISGLVYEHLEDEKKQIEAEKSQEAAE